MVRGNVEDLVSSGMAAHSGEVVRPHRHDDYVVIVSARPDPRALATDTSTSTRMSRQDAQTFRSSMLARARRERSLWKPKNLAKALGRVLRFR